MPSALLCWWVLTGQGLRLAEALMAAPRGKPSPLSIRGHAGGRFVKRVLDIIVAAATLVVLAPILLATALLIAVSLGRPVLFAHERVGRKGHRFRCFKFRTMVTDAEARLAEVLARDPALAAEWQETRKLRNDPRVTRLGLVLRRTSIDELPQLLNVLRGDMSCVGPRPVTADELGRYGDAAEAYLAARPGLTGLWQVSGRSALSYQARVALDGLYAARRSLLLDIVILLRTIPALFRTQESA